MLPRRETPRRWPPGSETPLEALTPPPGFTIPFPTPVLGPRPQPLRPASAALDRLRNGLRTAHYSHRREKAYLYWAGRFAAFYAGRSLDDMGADEIRSFLSHLAIDKSAATQNQALCAPLFLFRVLGKDVGPIERIDRAKAPKRLPVVLTQSEVRTVLDAMQGVPRLVCWLLYGTGLRLLEGLCLRVKDEMERP